MNIEDITSTIKKLEDGDTTFENCYKLASLYIIRDRQLKRQYEDDNEGIQKELEDILPQYKKYVSIKRKYQLGEVSEQVVEKSIKYVCEEILEFIQTFYRCTDLPIERQYIIKLIQDIEKIP